MNERKPSYDRRRTGPAPNFLLRLLVAACLMPIAAGTLRAQGQSAGSISGRVMGPQGQLERVQVQLLAEGDLPAGEAYTNSNGNFSFGGLPFGRYWIVIQTEGYRPVRQAVQIDLRYGPNAQVDVPLEPAKKSEKPTAQAIAGGSRILNAKHRTAPFDSKAVREFEKANKLKGQGKLEAATTHYQRALEISPDFYPALNNLGSIYLRQNDIARAKAAFLKSLDLNVDDGEAYINLGNVLYDEGKYREAVERLEEGLKRSPGSAVGHLFLGSTYLKLGELEKAEANLKQAYALDPSGMAGARLQLANLYLRRHDLRAAGAELEGYLQANPSDPQAPAIKKTLASIKGH